MHRIHRIPIPTLRAGLAAVVAIIGSSAPSKCGAAEDCKNPVCKDTQDMLRLALRSEPSSGPPILCPPDRATLGKHSWTLIHTMAAHYPEEPSEYQRQLHAVIEC